MTDYKEEQSMEVEALESIYMDEFHPISTEPLRYELHVVPNQDGENNHVEVTLRCSIPETYPDAVPKIELVLERGLSDTHGKEIQEILNRQVEENTGMAMMYTICEAVREYLVENNREGQDGSEYQEMMRRLEIRKKQDDKTAATEQEIKDAVVAAKPRNLGTAVTPESFVAWRETFEAEMRELEKSAGKEDISQKLTGKQLWMRGLVTEEAADEVAGEGEEGDDDDNEDEDEDYVPDDDEALDAEDDEEADVIDK